MPESERLIEIESQLAQIARHVEQLDEVLVDHGKTLERLAGLLLRLDARVTRIESVIESGRKTLGSEPEASPWKDPEM
ncbi:MAG: SlyX family protein [Planctomycetes bacterium]|nr:SlyX family protein [Planctomycetota bacterium]